MIDRKWKLHCLVAVQNEHVILRMKNEDHWFADLFWPDEGLKLLVCRLSLTNFAFRKISEMSRKVWYLNEEWELLVCRLGSDQLCINRHWHCLQTETVSLAGLQNCSDQLCIFGTGNLRAETVCCGMFAPAWLVWGFWTFEAEQSEKAKRKWGNVWTEQGRGGAEHRQARKGKSCRAWWIKFGSHFDKWITRQSWEDYGSLEERWW